MAGTLGVACCRTCVSSRRRKCEPCRTQTLRRAEGLGLWWLCFFVLCCVWTAEGSTMGEDCDWFGSGLSGPERGVSPVYLRCSQGRLEWAYPRGALRVLLRLGGSGADFRGCVRVADSSSGARVFLEGPRALFPLFAEGGAPRLVRCFRSRAGQAALYVESLPKATGDISKQVAAFTYDLEPLPRNGKGYDPAEQCRPCTEEEMSRAFCTSDLVARGIIRGIQNRPELEVTEMSVKVTKLLRRSTYGNAGLLCSGGDNDLVPDCNQQDQVKAREEQEARRPTQPEDESVAVQIPAHCGARHGSGEFVFMARRKLGDLALTCAPRLEDWVTVVRRLENAGTAHCVLAS